MEKEKEAKMPVEYGTWFVVKDTANVAAFLKYDEDAMDLALKYIRDAIKSAAEYQYDYKSGERVAKIVIEARYYPNLTMMKEELEVK